MIKLISGEILNKLIPVTEEEKEILGNGSSINQSRYMESGSSVINSKKLLEQGKLIAIRSHPRFIDFPPHSHDYIEVVYMCKGNTEHIINGNSVLLKEGELLFLSTNAVQEIKCANENDIAVNFVILPQFFDKVLEMLGEEESPLKSFVIDSLSKKDNKNSYLHFKVADILTIQNLIENLLYNLLSDVRGKRNVNQTTMGLLLIELINHTDRLSLQQTTDTVLLDVFRYIEENYSRGSLGELADILHYDLYWLSREIKRLTGKTYTELLQEKRLSQAAFLLKTTKINVADISVAVGYENVSYFHRLFSCKFGLSPRDYRNCK